MKLYKAISILFLSVTLSSCNKWLEVAPENTIPDDELFSDGFGFRNALNGVYLTLATKDLYGQELGWGFVSAISQQYYQVKSGSFNPPYEDAALLLYKTPRTEGVVKSFWEQGYKVIANLNKMLSYLDKSDPGIFSYGREEMDLIRGEVLALRAMMHFDLLRLFAPAPVSGTSGRYMPYRDSYSADVAENLTVAEFMGKVTRDIEEAKVLLRRFDVEYHPAGMYAAGVAESNRDTHFNARQRLEITGADMATFFWFRGLRVNYMAALGLAARMYMYGEDYVNAETNASELYGEFYEHRKWVGFNTDLTIVQNIDQRYTKMADDILFAVYYDDLASDYRQSTMDNYGLSRIPVANGAALFKTDGTPYEDWRLKYTMNPVPGSGGESDKVMYYSLKYNQGVTPIDAIAKMEHPLSPVIRLSEVCHILAEISARNGDFVNARKYLQTVREARGAFRPLVADNYDDMMREIITDARKEFLGEGQTFFLYKRLNTAQIENSDGTGWLSMSGKYVLPVPDSESGI